MICESVWYFIYFYVDFYLPETWEKKKWRMYQLTWDIEEQNEMYTDVVCALYAKAKIVPSRTAFWCPPAQSIGLRWAWP